MRVRTLEEILFPEGLAPDKDIPFDPTPALQIVISNVPSQELSQSTSQLPIAARKAGMKMGTLKDIADRGLEIARDLMNAEISEKTSDSNHRIERIDNRGRNIAQDIRDKAADKDYRW